jgi:hypothetical protein
MSTSSASYDGFTLKGCLTAPNYDGFTLKGCLKIPNYDGIAQKGCQALAVGVDLLSS